MPWDARWLEGVGPKGQAEARPPVSIPRQEAPREFLQVRRLADAQLDRVRARRHGRGRVVVAILTLAGHPPGIDRTRGPAGGRGRPVRHVHRHRAGDRAGAPGRAHV